MKCAPWAAAFGLALADPAPAVELEGLLDLRLVRGDAVPSWTEQSLGKQRFDAGHDGLRLGQAIAVLRAQPWDTVTATLAANGYDERHGYAAVSEAFLSWKPVPGGPWRNRVKLGAFFPALSLENTGPGWSAPDLLSTSAINTWLGEEVRTIGAEWTLSRPGRYTGSPHDLEASLGAFGWNDPAGALLAWRGWSVGDRITGLNERLEFAPLPVFGPGGALRKQKPWVEPYAEIDNRLGYHAGARYGYGGRVTLAAFHYDNRGEPRAFRNGQYAWATRFDQLSLRLTPAEGWEFLAQALEGDTAMGWSRRRGVHLDYAAAYALLARDFGAHRLSLRRDWFETEDRDSTPEDDNGEQGEAWALAWRWRWRESAELVAEWLAIASEREAWEYLDEAPKHRVEQSLSLALRWRF